MALSVVLTYKRYIVIIRLPTPVNEAFIVPSFLFPRLKLPPTTSKKKQQDGTRRPSHPNATPATFAERRQQAERSDPLSVVKSDFAFARSKGQNLPCLLEILSFLPLHPVVEPMKGWMKG